MTDVLPDHLGGAITEGPHGDEATWFPDMWKWVVRELGVRSVLDIGCGAGHSTSFFQKLGCDVLGIDGVSCENLSHDFVQHDFTQGPVPRPYDDVPVDLGWCCEFLEHIEEKYLVNLITTFGNCKVILVTHAFPGQPGHHHVNCRTPDYWQGFFTGIGFTFDRELTRQTKLMARKNTHPLNHYVRSGLAFRRAT